MVNTGKLDLGLVTLVLILFLFPIVSALPEADFVTTFNRNYTLSVSVSVNGIDATSLNTQCNFSVKDTLGRYILKQVNASINDAGYASIELNASSLRVIGQYPFKTSCISGGLNQSVNGVLETTSSGEDDNNNNYIILFLGISAFLLMGMGISYSNYIFGFIAGVLFFISAIYVFQYGLFSFQDIYSQSIGAMFILMGVWNELGAGYTVLEDLNVKFS